MKKYQSLFGLATIPVAASPSWTAPHTITADDSITHTDILRVTAAHFRGAPTEREEYLLPSASQVSCQLRHD